MTERILGSTGARRKRLWLIGPLAALAAFIGLFAASGAVALPAADCATLNHLSGSAFEIDVNANLAVNGAAADCIDWDSASVNDLSTGDLPTGSGDDSFGQGTAENNPNPTIVDGSIPPNKSDLKRFGIYTESTASGKFLELYWARVQNPQGTTNMDFELNQTACDGTAANCAQNGSTKNPLYVTPKWTEGDKLITYDLSKGGTVPGISIRDWNGTEWGAADVISGPGGDALGAVNTSDIAASEIGPQSAFTFGEVAIDFDVIFDSNECGSFGSVYLKSRSSDSFTSELKDFIAPEDVFISNCAGIVTNAVATANLGENIHDTATLSDVGADAGGSITFTLYGPSDTADCSGDAIFTSVNEEIDGPGDYDSGDFAPTEPGTYYWIAAYSGDGSNSSAATECGDENESSVISKADSTISTAQVLVPNDSATIGGGGTLDGSATFSLFKPGQTCEEGSSDTPVYTVAVDVDGSSEQTVSTNNGDDTDELAGSHADALGTWSWLVTYDGDSTHNDSVSNCTETFTIDE